jgi:hypothetical protein
MVKQRRVSGAFVGMAAVTLFALPVFQSRTWAPFYSFYLNPIGGGTRNITRYFAPDEVSEFDTREVAQSVCRSAPRSARLSTARPMSMSYYLETCERTDIKIISLYDPKYVPQDGDLIVLEPSRRFFETQRFFDVLGKSDMAHTPVRVGPVLASTIYRFDSSASTARTLQESSTVSQLRESPFRFEAKAEQRESAARAGAPSNR